MIVLDLSNEFDHRNIAFAMSAAVDICEEYYEVRAYTKLTNSTLLSSRL